MKMLPSPFAVYRTAAMPPGDRLGIGVLDKSGCDGSEECRVYDGLVIMLLLRGRGRFTLAREKRVFELTPGSWFLRRPGEEHQIEIDPASGWLECFIDFGRLLAPLLAAYSRLPERPAGRLEAPERLVLRAAALADALREAPEHRLGELLPEFLAFAADFPGAGPRPDSEGEKMLRLGCAYLGRDFRNPVDLAGFCRRHGWSYENFRKRFRAALGVSPHQYRIRRRLDAARALLRENRLGLAAIAAELGYASVFEFSAQFKRRTGVAPSLWRRQGELN